MQFFTIRLENNLSFTLNKQDADFQSNKLYRKEAQHLNSMFRIHHTYKF